MTIKISKFFASFKEKKWKARFDSIIPVGDVVIVTGRKDKVSTEGDYVAIYNKLTDEWTKQVDPVTAFLALDHAAPISKSENGMTAEDLVDKYSAQGNHPDHPRDLWFADVASKETQLGYWAWVEARLSSGRE